MEKGKIFIYTDGSCNTDLKTGAWASIIICDEKKYQIEGIEMDTTHNRMELVAVINAIDFTVNNISDNSEINICTDSQYVVDIPRRREKFLRTDYCNSKGKALQNNDLLRKMVSSLDHFNIRLLKIKAHQKSDGSINLNRNVDKLVRSILRSHIDKHKNPQI